jgi:hypothetical protein
MCSAEGFIERLEAQWRAERNDKRRVKIAAAIEKARGWVRTETAQSPPDCLFGVEA